MLIIFDCDGVLVDSEPLANQVLAAFLSELGLPHTTEECSANYVGMSIPSLIAKVEHETGKTLPKDFHDELWRRDQIAFADRLQPIRGIAETLEQLNGPRCVASSSAPVRIMNSLTTTGLIGFFEPYLYSATQVANGKPAPDLFLFAAAEMGVAPNDCVVIEDSVPGVQAGKAAGMRVLGFSGGGHCGPEHNGRLNGAGADVVFSDMAQLSDLI
jgi:HAD superfamily hydrolase (TIGR01509 family)